MAIPALKLALPSPSLLMQDQYDVLQYISHGRVPFLVIHGECDQ